MAPVDKARERPHTRAPHAANVSVAAAHAVTGAPVNGSLRLDARLARLNVAGIAADLHATTGVALMYTGSRAQNLTPQGSTTEAGTQGDDLTTLNHRLGMRVQLALPNLPWLASGVALLAAQQNVRGEKRWRTVDTAKDGAVVRVIEDRTVTSVHRAGAAIALSLSARITKRVSIFAEVEQAMLFTVSQGGSSDYAYDNAPVHIRTHEAAAPKAAERVAPLVLSLGASVVLF
ncbi:MAG: hypothetical protein IT381_18885 [Deltaproteobacteria bacterium]|nr:hypothetical protein [Deltaproteobacteria bacterium]